MNFIQLAMEAGFSKEQAEFIEEHLAKVGHTHDAEDIEGLDMAIEGILEEENEDEDEE